MSLLVPSAAPQREAWQGWTRVPCDLHTVKEQWGELLGIAGHVGHREKEASGDMVSEGLAGACDPQIPPVWLRGKVCAGQE